MLLAYDYPLLSILLTLFVFFFWIIWLLLLFKVFADIFRSHDLGGLAKAGWLLLVIALPFLGVIIYLIARGSAMNQRAVARAQAEGAFPRD